MSKPSKPTLLISACLLGVPCRYDGKAKPCPATAELERFFQLLPVCPEVLGGLSTPRAPSELQLDGRIVSQAGQDVTAEYQAGARAALSLAQKSNCRLAVLKEKSPSCGYGAVYDGSFSKTLKSGNGVTAQLLFENGFTVLGESRISELIREIADNSNIDRLNAGSEIVENDEIAKK